MKIKINAFMYMPIEIFQYNIYKHPVILQRCATFAALLSSALTGTRTACQGARVKHE